MSKLMKENAEKHYLLAKKVYESGAGTQLDLHDANVSLINAQMSFMKARFDYLMTMARLSGLVGLGEDTLCKK
jgi:outer membrane protein TolC